MKILKAIIIEDNRFMATVLKDMLTPFQKKISVEGIAYSGGEGLKMIASTKPDIVFLDVELTDMTGFELLNTCPELNFKTIFTTAHSHYAIKAIRFNALDYLVKPIKENELREAINRLDEIRQSTLKGALKNLASKTEEQKLVLPTQSGTLRFSLKQITYIVSERNYSFIHLTNGSKELSSKNLAYFEEILEDKGFYRCHRSYLVNIYHIDRLEQDYFVLKDDFIISISRRKKTDAKRWFYNDAAPE